MVTQREIVNLHTWILNPTLKCKGKFWRAFKFKLFKIFINKKKYLQKKLLIFFFMKMKKLIVNLKSAIKIILN